MIDKINKVIGLPYDAYKAHCWDLVEYLVPNAPKLSVAAESLTASVRHFKEEKAKYNLQEVTEFKDGDILLLGKDKTLFHAGVYFNGGVVHASTTGVVYERLQDIKRTYSLIKGLRA